MDFMKLPSYFDYNKGCIDISYKFAGHRFIGKRPRIDQRSGFGKSLGCQFQLLRKCKQFFWIGDTMPTIGG